MSQLPKEITIISMENLLQVHPYEASTYVHCTNNNWCSILAFHTRLNLLATKALWPLRLYKEKIYYMQMLL